MNLPKDYQSKMQEMLGEEYLQYLDSFNHSYGQTLRVNQLKMEPAVLLCRSLLFAGAECDGTSSVFTSRTGRQGA